jgi:hypothetical protein
LPTSWNFKQTVKRKEIEADDYFLLSRIFLIFLNFVANKLPEVFSRYLSMPPLFSTDLMAAADTLAFMHMPRMSLVNDTICKFGKNLRFVLLLAWLTLLPHTAAFPDREQTLDIAKLSIENVQS